MPNKIKATLKHLWSLRRQFLKYSIIGSSAFIIDMSSLYSLKEYVGLAPVTAVVLNQIFIINYVFFLNKKWSFKAVGPTHKQMIKFYMLAVFNYLVAIVWMWIFFDHLHVHYLIARITNIILAVAWNFLTYKYWVYKEDAIKQQI